MFCRKSCADRRANKTERQVHDSASASATQNCPEFVQSSAETPSKDVDSSVLNYGIARDKKQPGSEVWAKSSIAEDTNCKARLKKLMAQQSHEVKEDILRTATPYLVKHAPWEDSDQVMHRQPEPRNVRNKDEILGLFLTW